ncbi:hypothetical protein TG4357_02738 [Thalassovita gelatinovora]|uniref:D-galactarate dehydratase n=1 Tax=Thalassovita gelatinovora TaxID=53501 RepID=A0A0P1FG80_THAGE|nr:hypothetical protein [Thalassovita gelatinovora]QIZ79858.1 hypothetical protein HFZ77_04855 [Thalassovita gelatinovora]CUH66958.1 hypothetical protein TG4357_02738 [Thalassovita gelatinovora]SEQ45727.1 hypothetical protein SAMN04488043_105276 [Thalassovita gelatinovora]
MKKLVLTLVPAFALSACTDVPLLGTPPWQRQAKPPVVSQPTEETLPAPDEIEIASLPDTGSAQPGSGGLLGMTVASLGDPARDGFWIETPLISAPGRGRVRYPANGREVKVELLPIEGPVTAGSRLSLGAMRLLDAPLSGLPKIEVYLD